MSHFIIEKEILTCGRKEKQENKIEENLSLEKRKKEKMPARRRNSIGLKDNSPDKFGQIHLGPHTTHVSNILYLGSKKSLNNNTHFLPKSWQRSANHRSHDHGARRLGVQGGAGAISYVGAGCV